MKKIIALLMLVLVIGCSSIQSSAVDASSTVTYTNASEICTYVYKGYNGGVNGPITITSGTLKNGNSSKDVYFITLSGTEMVSDQTTGYLTDALAGFNLSNKYYTNCRKIIQNNIPAGSNLILAGHSLGGMIAQQVAADSAIKSNYVVLNTVCFGSPLLAAGSREGVVKRLGDTADVVPYLSGSLINNTIWAIAGLNRESGGYDFASEDAHVKSYIRSDVWGKYDVTGQKNGSATLTLDLDTLAYYHSSTSTY